MLSRYEIKKAVIDALKEPIETIDSDIFVEQEVDGFTHPTGIKFGPRDKQVVARRIIKELNRL